MTDTPTAEEVVESRKASTNLKDSPTLNAAERKALKDLVDNDFNALENSLRQAFHDRERDLHREGVKRAEEERERAQDLIDKAYALNDKQRKEREAFIAKAEKARVSFEGRANVLQFTGIPSTLEAEKRNLASDYEAARTALRMLYLDHVGESA